MFKVGVNKASVEKSSFVLNIMIYMFTAIHFLACSWIYIGVIVPCSWMHRGDEECKVDGKPYGIIVDKNNPTDIYIISVYWVITTLTTVGYGDFKGYVSDEYLF